MRARRTGVSTRRAIPTLIAAIMAGGATCAQAQTPALEEVIVTAQKQRERLQDVPISIQSFGAQALENANVTSFADMRTLAPSVEIKSYPVASEDLLVQIRGVPSQAMNIFTDLATPIHIDGVYIARGSGLNLTVADLDSVEILKGPQGTLYGRNAISGAVNMVTSRPTQEFGFSQNLTVGNYGKMVTKTSLNVPVTETLAMKLAFVHDQRDGFISDSNGGSRDWGDRKADAGRFDVRWKPSSRVTVDYGYDTARTRYTSSVNQCLNQLNSLEPFAPTALAYTADPWLCTGKRLDSLPMPNNANVRMSPESTVRNSGHNLTINVALSDDTTLRSITGYRTLRDTHYWGVLTGDYTTMADANINFPGNVYVPNGLGGVIGPISAAGLVMPAKSHKINDDYWSQEFVLLGKLGPSLKYTAGVYYFKEDGKQTEAPGSGLMVNLAGAGVLPGGQSPMELISVFQGEQAKADNRSWAIFGQATWTPGILDNKLDITAGLRYTKDKRDASVYYGGNDTYLSVPYGMAPGALANFAVTSAMPPGLLMLPGGPRIGAPGQPVSGSVTSSKTTPSLTVQYHVYPDVQTYAKVARGYRSGGFNDQSANGVNFAKGYKPETMTSVELGMKGDFLDKRLRTNLAVFRSKYNDQQVNVSGDQLRVYEMLNAGKSTYKGYELDLAAAVTSALRLGLNFTHVTFDYDKIVDQGVDVTRFYHMLPAKNTYAATLDYAFGNVGPGRLNWHLDYAHVDKTYTNTADLYTISGGTATLLARTNPGSLTTPSYGVWNTRLAMVVPMAKIGGGRGDLTVGLWVKNVTDKKYTAFNIDYGKYGTPFGMAAVWGDPKTYGMDLTYRY